jgi:hypothetical protein
MRMLIIGETGSMSVPGRDSDSQSPGNAHEWVVRLMGGRILRCLRVAVYRAYRSEIDRIIEGGDEQAHE